MFNVVSAKLTGTPGSAGWAQVHEFDPEDASKKLQRGKLFTVLATSHVESGIDVIASGRELLARLHEEYFGNLEAKPFNALKSSVQKVSTEFGESWGEVEIVAMAVLGNVVYCAAVGGGGVMIVRDGSLATILKSVNSEAISASGFPKDNDTILLATKNFFTTVPMGVIKATLSAPSPADSASNLGTLIHGSDGTSSLGAIILRFEKTAGLVQTNVSEEEREVPVYNSSPTIGNRLRSFLTNLSLRLPKKNIYIKQTLTEEISPQSKKTTFLIALILLALLGISVVFGVRQKKINDAKNKYQGILNEASSEIDQAISLASVSQDKSRELFGDAENKLKQVEALSVKDSTLDALKKKINDSRASILGEYVGPPSMFLDLTLLSSGFRGDTIAFSGGQIYILDSDGKRIIGVDASTKKSKVVAGPSTLNSASGLACYEKRVFVLESDGIYEVGSGSLKVVNKTWSGDAFISAFAGNLYVVDKDGSAVYRYQGQNTAFGDKQNWLAGGTNVNFSNVLQIAIDGSLYTLYPNAKILKFNQGTPQNFNIKGAIPDVGNVNAISASPDNQNVYLLDRAGKRVVVTDKKGTYKAQYADEGISQAVGIVASESDKKIILLTGDKLYSLDIQNQ